MFRAFVQLEKVEDVKRFVALCNEVPFAVDLLAGEFVVDAKSIIGIFSLDLSQKVALRAACGGEEAGAFAEKIREFLVES
jgi:phosphotransferase system HPr-like phosphotransfer protein